MTVRKTSSKITFAKKRVAKADTKLVIVDPILQVEDEFGNMYDMHKSNAAIMPPFNPMVLKSLCTRNNILQQCVHAMETNVDGTGHEIADEDQDKEDPNEKLQAALGAPTAPITPEQIASGASPLPDPSRILTGLSSMLPEGVAPEVGGAAAAAVVMQGKGAQGATGEAPAPVATGATGPVPVAKAFPFPSQGATGATATTGKVLPFGNPTQDATGGPQGATGATGGPPVPGAPIPGAVDPATGLPLPSAGVSTDTPEEAMEKKRLEAFFKEPFPNESMVAIRRKLRYDLESTGNGYLEVIRNMAGTVVFLRHLDCSTMRLVRLDNAVSVERQIDRDGEVFTANIMVRERRFVQRVGTQYIYFKEFGSERKLNREDGTWIDQEDNGIHASGAAAATSRASDSTPLLTLKADTQQRLDSNVAPGPANTTGKKDQYQSTNINKPKPLASEVLHFIVDKDPRTPYGIPRWINNLPAVLGSRKAEEFNLEFFDAGGLPPAIVFISGGALASGVREQLLNYMSGSNSDKRRGAVVEAQSSSGSLDSTGQVKIQVERFGDNRANGTDSMFQVYDGKCYDHVRGAFRLPTIFLGTSSDMNFATALTAVMVTEAQVFAPERMEFDEVMNHTIVRALGAKKYTFKSKPITLKNVEIQLKGLEMANGKIDGQALIESINQITGLNLVYSASAEKAAQDQAMAAAQKPGQPGAFGQGGDPKAAEGGGKPNPFAPALGAPSGGGGLASVAMKSDLTSNEIVLLAGEWSNAVGLTTGPRLDKEVRRAIIHKVEALPKDQRTLFNAVLANSTFARSQFDQEGLTELAGCCVGFMDHTH